MDKFSEIMAFVFMILFAITALISIVGLIIVVPIGVLECICIILNIILCLMWGYDNFRTWRHYRKMNTLD